MSSFICGPKHFNSIEKALTILFQHDNYFRYTYELNDISEILANTTKISVEKICSEIKKFINELRDLNAICVTLQYAHHYEGKINQEIQSAKKFTRSTEEHKELTLHGLYNALRCLTYQIEIEHLEELGGLSNEQKQAMKFINIMENKLARAIIIKLPDDPTNTWEVT